LTNFSTGRLGSELATYLSQKGHTVTLLIGQQATWRGERNAARVETFSTTADLLEKLRAEPDVQGLFHAAAVSDFTFGKIWERNAEGQLKEVKARKIPTSSTGLLAELVPTPKIIAELRRLFPHAWLTGWKYELDGDRVEVVKKAVMQIAQNRTNACVVNGAAYGEGFGIVTVSDKMRDGSRHIAAGGDTRAPGAVIDPEKVEHCGTRELLFARLERLFVESFTT
jgi:phosphopantothenoylcysteine decarboxylase/phosphopantothenate--cysteine ligase